MKKGKVVKILSEELKHSNFHLNESGKAPQFYKEMGDYCKALQSAISAVCKQIPMQVIGDPYYEQCGCPKCKQQVYGKYCEWCGQKLKWEDE